MAESIEFVYDDLVTFSNNFSIELGGGGAGKVYQGQIPNDNRYGLPEMPIAIKRATLGTHDAEIIRQFQTEKDCLERFRHANIIKLIGFCFNDQGRYLILEYCPLGKIGSNIEGLNWEATLDILCKVAEAIQYVHSLGEGVHGDISLGNVLLMENLEPKLSDFGTFIHEDNLNHQTTSSKTLGFTDPQNWKVERLLTPDDDVYAFGMVMMRVITKTRKASDEELQTGNYEYAKSLFDNEGTLVHRKLLDSGCSPDNAKLISKLVFELIEEHCQTSLEDFRESYLKQCESGVGVSYPKEWDTVYRRIKRPPISYVAHQLKLLRFP